MTTAVNIGPIPYSTPFLTQNGMISPIWSKWLQQLYLRAGGSTSTSIAALQGDIVVLQGNIATLQVEITTLNTQIFNLQGLNVGPDL